MMRLLKIELRKILNNRAAKILVSSYFILLALITLVSLVKFSILGQEISLAEEGMFEFPLIWHFNTYIAASLKILLAVVIISMMTNEYTYGTLKQNLIDGLSKEEFITSKVLAITLFALISTIILGLVSLALGIKYSTSTEIGLVFTDVDYLLAYFVKLVAFFSFCLFLAILVKKSAFSLAFLFLWNIAETIFIAIVNIMSPFGSRIADYFSMLMPLESMSRLIPNPIFRLSISRKVETLMTGQESISQFSVNYVQVCIVVVWTAIFIAASYALLKKRDL